MLPTVETPEPRDVYDMLTSVGAIVCILALLCFQIWSVVLVSRLSLQLHDAISSSLGAHEDTQAMLESLGATHP